MLNTLSEAYKVCQLRGMSLEPLQAFYHITLGNARALGMDNGIGNLKPGSDADFLILDGFSNSESVSSSENNDVDHPSLKKRLDKCTSIQEEWFAYMMLGDERAIAETWIAGQKQHQKRDPKSSKAKTPSAAPPYPEKQAMRSLM